MKLKFDLVFPKINRKNPVKKDISCAKQCLKGQKYAKTACHTVGYYRRKLNKNIFYRFKNTSDGIIYSVID